MLDSPVFDDSLSAGFVRPTFDDLIVGPADDVDSGDAAAARTYVWQARAWLPPTKLQRPGLTL